MKDTFVMVLPKCVSIVHVKASVHMCVRLYVFVCVRVCLCVRVCGVCTVGSNHIAVLF